MFEKWLTNEVAGSEPPFNDDHLLLFVERIMLADISRPN